MRLTAIVFLFRLSRSNSSYCFRAGRTSFQPECPHIATVAHQARGPLHSGGKRLQCCAPLKKAAVVVNRTDVQPNLNTPPPSYSTTTDATGKFAMKDIEPGKYRMMVTRNGFVSMTYGARGPNRPGTTLTLERAQKMKDVNFRLTPHAVVAGRIVDEDGEPIPFVSVQLVRFQVRQGRQQLNMAGGSGTTNDLGEYRVFGVAPGKYYLRATGQRSGSPFGVLDRTANSQPEEDYVPTYYPGTIDTANARQSRSGAELRSAGSISHY